MSATVTVNGRTIVHKKSKGVSTAFPDVCLTPPGPVPIPYPNVAFSKHTKKGSKTLTVDGVPIMLKNSFFSTSTGDEPGTGKGVISGRIKGKASFINYSFDVKVEGQNVPRQMDPMKHNHGSAGNAISPSEIQPSMVVPSAMETVCGHVCECDKNKKSSETKDQCLHRKLSKADKDKNYTSTIKSQPAYRMKQNGKWLKPPKYFHGRNNSLRPSRFWPAHMKKSDWKKYKSGDTRIPDVIVVKDPTKPATIDNIKEVMEVKFKDKHSTLDSYGKGQKRAYDKLAQQAGVESGRHQLVTVEICQEKEYCQKQK